MRAADIRFVPDVVYLTPDRSERLDLYLPAASPTAGLSPALVWLHGSNGDKGEKRGHIICEMLAREGYVCVSVNYETARAGQGRGARSLMDCKNAVRFLRAHAAQYHIDPKRVAVGGGSAGGALAVMVGLSPNRPNGEPKEPYPGVSDAVSAILDFYGPMDIRQGHSLADYVTASTPPVLVLQGDKDPTVLPENSIVLSEALKAKGVPYQFLMLPGVDHSFRLTTTWDDKPLPLDLGPVVLNFLNKYLKP